jgi:NADH-quinone oxidoreductase subunit F
MTDKRINSPEQLKSLAKSCRKKNEVKTDKILLCAGGGCIASGAMQVKESLINALNNAELADKYTVVETGCLGPCSGGPVVVIGKDKTFYQKVGSLDCTEIVTSHLVHGKVVDRLTWKEHEGEKPVPVMSDIDFFKRQTKIVLRNCGDIDPEKIEDYIGKDGYEALSSVLTGMTPAPACAAAAARASRPA